MPQISGGVRPSQRQVGKVGKVWRHHDGTPCLRCGSILYSLVFRMQARTERGGLIAVCRQCHEECQVQSDTTSPDMH